MNRMLKNIELPDMCLIFCPSKGPGNYIAAIINGQPGLHPTTHNEQDAKRAHQLVTEMNAKLGVTPAIAGCMQVGALFGWDVPGATPKEIAHSISTATLAPLLALKPANPVHIRV